MEHENEHLDIREKLLRLPKLQADENFLKRLQIQIDILDSEEKTRDVVDKGSVSGYFKNIFGARLVPALGITSVVVVAVLVYFMLVDNKTSVVDTMTGNKNQQTVITKEKPSGNNSTQQNEKKELSKTETNTPTDNSKRNNSPNNISSRENNEVRNGFVPAPVTTPPAPESTIEKDLAQEIQSKTSGTVQDERSGQINIRSGRTNEKTESAKSIKGSDTKKNTNIDATTKSSDEGTQKDGIMNKAPVVSEQEKTVNEGGRGNTSKKTSSNVKPKKKEINVDIDKNVLETLRDKLK